MLKVMIASGVLFVINVVHASSKSLDEMFNQQTQVEISPVSIDGNSIGTLADVSRAVERSMPFQAARLCGSLGYLRLVKFESEPCVVGEKIYEVGTPMGISAAIIRPAINSRGSDGKCGDFHDFALKLKSVTCAK